MENNKEILQFLRENPPETYFVLNKVKQNYQIHIYLEPQTPVSTRIESTEIKPPVITVTVIIFVNRDTGDKDKCLAKFPLDEIKGICPWRWDHGKINDLDMMLKL